MIWGKGLLRKLGDKNSECPLSAVSGGTIKLEGDKVFHHPVMVYPRFFSHDDILEVVELKSGNDVLKGKHEDLSATNAIAIDESRCESGSTRSDHGKDCPVKNQIENEKCVPSPENAVENGDKNVSDSDVAKVIVCCKDNACFEFKDICIDEGLPTNLHMSAEKEKDEITSSAEADLINKIGSPSLEVSGLLEVKTREDPAILSCHEDSEKAVVGEDMVSEATSAESTDHTAHGSDMKDLGEEYLFSSSKSPKCEEVNSSASTESLGSGIIFGPFDRNNFENSATNNQDNTATIAALIYGSGETNLATETTESGSITLAFDAPSISSSTKESNSFDPVNQDKSKADAVSIRRPESLEDRHDHGESSFSYAGPVSGSVTYSGPIAFSGSLSLRSDSSTTSTRSFAFPILQNEWNSSPVRMSKGDRRRHHKHRGWSYGILCCRF